MSEEQEEELIKAKEKTKAKGKDKVLIRNQGCIFFNKIEFRSLQFI